MVKIDDHVHVDAPPAAVWNAIEDPVAHADWHPYLVRITGEHRAGAERTCSVLIGKRAGETRERCTEADPERAITWSIEHDTTGFSRVVADWQAGFTLAPQDHRTLVTARSAFQPKGLRVRLMGPIVRHKFHGTQRAILAALKESVEMSHPADVLAQRGSGSPARK